MKKLIAVAMASFMLFATGCSTGVQDDGTFSVSMVTDTGGVNDGSFNQSAWAGLTRFSQDTGAEVNYIESKQTSDYITNIDRSVDRNYDMIWGVGYGMCDSLDREARLNPNQHFGLIDTTYDDIPPNVCTVTFKAQEGAFIVGYIAGMTTETNKVGFVGGMQSVMVDQFEYGYRAGVEYAAKELGKDIDVQIQYAQSYSDVAKAKQIALKMYSDGCDIIFHAAGQCGNGVIAAATDQDKYAIGVDSDQAYLSPDHVLTSALKRVDNAIYEISEKVMEGEDVYGVNYEFGLAEDCVGIPEDNPNVDPVVYEKAMDVEQLIRNGDIVPPYDQATFDAYLANEA